VTSAAPLFWLGAHHPAWLGTAGVPLFVSRRTLFERRTFPVACAPWALDSGGFSELSIHGCWTVTPGDYVADVRRFRDEIGSLAWAAPQDWMCEPGMLSRTGLSVPEHQRRTVANYLVLRDLAPELPIIPVVQGWTMGDYLDCVELYDREGVDLSLLPLVGIGTICRRQHTSRAEQIIRMIAADGIRLHGFGLKVTGLRACADAIVSADSMAWSYQARRRPPMDGCRGHANCANCIRYALEWRAELLESMSDGARQLSLGLAVSA
jgi:hypothetical protein